MESDKQISCSQTPMLTRAISSRVAEREGISNPGGKEKVSADYINHNERLFKPLEQDNGYLSPQEEKEGYISPYSYARTPGRLGLRPKKETSEPATPLPAIVSRPRPNRHTYLQVLPTELPIPPTANPRGTWEHSSTAEEHIYSLISDDYVPPAQLGIVSIENTPEDPTIPPAQNKRLDVNPRERPKFNRITVRNIIIVLLAAIVIAGSLWALQRYAFGTGGARPITTTSITYTTDMYAIQTTEDPGLPAGCESDYVGSPGGYPWDEESFSENGPITALRVWVNYTQVTGIQAQYGVSWSFVRGGSGGVLTTFTFMPGEYINAIEGHHGTEHQFKSFRTITGLQFTTNLQRFPAVGGLAWTADVTFSETGVKLLYLEGMSSEGFIDGLRFHFAAC